MEPSSHKTIISLMLAVPDTPKAVEWYQKAVSAEISDAWSNRTHLQRSGLRGTE